MLTVITPQEARKIIFDRFMPLYTPTESVALADALGRSLYDDIVSDEYVPGFNRSTVDGYAVVASDTFGCSESIPAVLELRGEVLMGESARYTLTPGNCVAVSTGGDLPEGADAVVMLERCEVYGERLIGVTSPIAPGNNIIYKGDDVSPGEMVLLKGTCVSPRDIGILAALGRSRINVRPKPTVAVISSGDELVDTQQTPERGQIRDVNAPMLEALIINSGATSINYGIIRDDENALRRIVKKAVGECDAVLLSGGSSAGTRDLTARVVGSEGEILFHGIAMKPGKPTILGAIDGKPFFGLPGHPVAAYFVAELFIRPLIARMMGSETKQRTVTSRISETLSSNHGRAEFVAVVLSDDGASATPIRGKSGLITKLAHSDGYICVPRDSEGVAKGALVTVTYWD
ncbi:MAG: molybdopterin molybdotransferase MoeA [Oscillospiraceae bacterium]|nr:molybdopterin molybdotransferase MoeA [Oscillospiraceae bacterium]